MEYLPCKLFLCKIGNNFYLASAHHTQGAIYHKMSEVQVKLIFLLNYFAWHLFPVNVHFRPAQMKDEQENYNWEKHFVGTRIVYGSTTELCLQPRNTFSIFLWASFHLKWEAISFFPIRLASSIPIGMLKTCWFGLQSLCLRNVPKNSLQITVDLIWSLSW